MSLNLPQLRPNALLSPVPKPHIHRPSPPQPTNSLKLLLFHRHPTETSALPHPAHLWKKHHRPSLRCQAAEEQLVAGRSAGGSTMDKIVEKLKKFGYVEGHDDESAAGSAGEKGSIQDVFYAENGEAPPRPRGGLLLSGPGEKVRFPWEMDGEHEGVDDRRGGSRLARRRSSHSSLAELTLPEGELRRLRLLAVRAKSRIKIGGTGVTEEVVDKIHEKWKTEEIVRLKCEGPPALNMKRMHEILERKTGGLAIWRSGSSLSMYRGVSYEVQQGKHQKSYGPRANSLDKVGVRTVENSLQTGARDILDMIPQESLSSRKTEEAVTSMQLKYDHEIDMLLDELGPRFTDWPGSGPCPVDADLLPGCISGYNPPFRLLPYGVRRSLGMKDQTALRRLARVLPPHFAIGRSRQLQGLAASMVKLWQKSSIAKISFKRGVQLTTSERMAEELKKLTGGTLLFRNNDHMVFYRGQDFLSFEITEKLMERERLAKVLQDEEEQARLKASSSLSSNIDIDEEQRIAGTLSETLEADSRWGRQLDGNLKNAMSRAAEVERHVRLVRKLERKLSIAEFKLSKAERALGKVEEFLKPAAQQSDPESITEEERFMFRKLGLKMKAFLLLGRRGVFDGTVENMHLHWKYRELVKIIVKAKTFAQVRNVALALEAESGGVLVSVDKVSKGFAVVVYRGRDYTRPPTIRPKNLLTKRKALARSIELQRQEDLKRHISNLRRRAGKLMSELSQMEAAKEHGDEELYAKLDSQYLSDEEEDSEDEDAYLDTFDGDLNLSYDEEAESSTTDNTHDEDGTYKDNSDDLGQG